MRRVQKKIPSFDEHSSKLIDQLESSGHYGTAQTYLKTRRSFIRFLNEYKLDSKIQMSDISATLIDSYNQYLRDRGLVRNTISFYNRVLRAMYNKAVYEYGMDDRHPFDHVYTGIDKTTSRAISERSIASMLSLDTRKNDSLTLSRDLFIFSYMMRGMPFVDMVYLKKSQIYNGNIVYTRRKTGATLRVKIEGEAKRIISKYVSLNPNSDYLFPILICKHNDRRKYSRYCSALSQYNRNLKKLSSMAKVGESISSYVARHSWASAARNIGSGMSVISEALGHRSEHTTRIYLGNFDSTLIDHANMKLIVRLRKYASTRSDKPLEMPVVSMKETNSSTKV